jgi:hypothetical protein
MPTQTTASRRRCGRLRRHAPWVRRSSRGRRRW